MRSKKIILAALLAMSAAVCTAQTRTVAHRGYWDTPNSAQNSLAALVRADQIGIYGTEIDVLVTSDGVPVVNHDDKIEGHLIEASSYADIRDIRLKNGETLPTLEQTLALGRVCQDLMLVVEIKPHSTREKEVAAVAAILAQIDKYGVEGQVEYISFSMEICKELKRLRPAAAIAYLRSDLAPAKIKELGLGGIDYHYMAFEKHPEWVAEAHAAGLYVNVWTINDKATMRRMIDLGVDFITTDDPELAQRLIAEKR